jgi:hypothetical protein
MDKAKLERLGISQAQYEDFLARGFDDLDIDELYNNKMSDSEYNENFEH